MTPETDRERRLRMALERTHGELNDLAALCYERMHKIGVLTEVYERLAYNLADFPELKLPITMAFYDDVQRIAKQIEYEREPR